MNPRFLLRKSAILAAGVLGIAILLNLQAEDQTAPAVAATKKEEKKADQKKVESKAEEMKSGRKIEIRLVWGSIEKSSNSGLKPLDQPTAKKLGMFKWKNYYVVTNTVVVVPSGKATRKIRLSEKCEAQLTDVGNSRLEVMVWGKGKPVIKKTESLTKPDLLTIAGDAENDCGWFILMKEVD